MNNDLLISLSKKIPILKIYKSNFNYTLIIKSDFILPVLNFLKKHSIYQFNILIDLCAVDYIQRKKRFELVYNLLSTVFSSRICLKASIDEITKVQSAVPVFSAAGWWEREVWDLFGIFFINHPDLRRILTDYGFKGFPLRKDFPLYGYQEIVFNEVKKSVVYESLELTQNFRTFNYLNSLSFSKKNI